MKKFFLSLVLLVVLAIACQAQTISSLPADTNPTQDDLTITVNDPSGTPANRKVTIGNIFLAMSLWNSCSDAGSNDTYACTLSPVPASLSTGAAFWFKANTANTGAATINFNTLGAKTIKKQHDQDLADNDIEVGQWVGVVYDGTNMQMFSHTANAGGVSSIAPLVLEDANTVSQRNSTNAQTLCVYNTYTSGTNYERGCIRFASNLFEIIAEKGSGGGTQRNIRLSAVNTSGFNTNTVEVTPTALQAPNSDMAINQFQSITMRQDGFIGFSSAARIKETAGYALKILDSGGSAGGTLAWVSSSPGALSGTNNDWDAGSGAYFKRLTASGAASLTGMSREGIDGQAHLLWNVDSADTITIKHEDSGSAASRRFNSCSGADIALAPGEAADTIYDNTTQRWRVCKIGGSGGGTTINSTDTVIPYRSNSTTFADSPLVREDANTIAQRNSTNAQTFFQYGTYTSGTNYERARIGVLDTTNFGIASEKGSGGGSARDITLNRDGTTLRFAGSVFLPSTNRSMSLGQSGNVWGQSWFNDILAEGSGAGGGRIRFYGSSGNAGEIASDTNRRHIYFIDGTTGNPYGTIMFKGHTITTLSGDQNNYTVEGNASGFMRWSSTGTHTVTGLSIGQGDGETHQIHNVGSGSIIIPNESGSSTAANRFHTNTGSDITIPADGIVDLIYDGTSSRFRASLRAVPTAGPSAFATLTDGGTITWATGGAAINNATVTLGGNRTLSITGAASGSTGTLIVVQDGTGGRTLTLPGSSKVINGGSGAVVLSGGASAIDILSWVYDGTNYYWTLGKNFN